MVKLVISGDKGIKIKMNARTKYTCFFFFHENICGIRKKFVTLRPKSIKKYRTYKKL